MSMALRDQPYLPLYVQDVLTDERLIECSAQSHGVYFRLLCILHKQERYGSICLKQKYKQTDSKTEDFALMLSKQMPFEQKQIYDSLLELTGEGVITIDGDYLLQKRMVKDGELSKIRSEIGKTGGSKVTKQYGKRGYLYLMSDGESKNKIGISINPQNRLYRLRSDLCLPKTFEIKDVIEVSDMGQSEDFAQNFFKEILDGEWLVDSYDNVIKKFALLKAKVKANNKANAENEIEVEIANENDTTRIGGMGERTGDFIDVDGEIVTDVLPILEYYEAQLNGTMRENGNIAWRPLVSKWFSEHIGESFKDSLHVKNSFKKFYLTAPRNGKVVLERNIDHL